MSVDASKGHKEMDYPEHLRTYSSFIQFTKVSIILLVILLSAMAFFLVR